MATTKQVYIGRPEVGYSKESPEQIIATRDIPRTVCLGRAWHAITSQRPMLVGSTKPSGCAQAATKAPSTQIPTGICWMRPRRRAGRQLGLLRISRECGQQDPLTWPIFRLRFPNRHSCENQWRGWLWAATCGNYLRGSYGAGPSRHFLQLHLHTAAEDSIWVGQALSPSFARCCM